MHRIIIDLLPNDNVFIKSYVNNLCEVRDYRSQYIAPNSSSISFSGLRHANLFPDMDRS